MFRRFLLYLLFPCVVLVPSALLAQLQQVGGISGQVRIAGGEFIPHQMVVDLQFRNATINTVYTDAEGRFAFSALEGNPYHVVINDEAYYPVDQLVNLRPDYPFANIEIYLRPRDPQKNADPLGARATGGNPFLVDPADYNKRFPKKAVKEYERGLDAEHKGKHDEAITRYLDAIKIAPEYYPAHNNLGALYLGRADFKSAEEHFRESIRLDPNEAQAYFNLANVLILTSRYPESEAVLSSGLQHRPDSAFGRFLEGCLYEHTARLAQAETSLRHAMALDPAMWQAQLEIVKLDLRQNRRDDAISLLQGFLKTFPTAPAAPKVKEMLQKMQASMPSAGTNAKPVGSNVPPQ